MYLQDVNPFDNVVLRRFAAFLYAFLMAKNMWKRRAGWRDREFYPWFAASSATLLATAAIAGAGCIFIPGAKLQWQCQMYIYVILNMMLNIHIIIFNIYIYENTDISLYI